MQTVTTIGLDIAKSVFQVHGIDAAGQVLIRRQLKRRTVRLQRPTLRREESSCQLGAVHTRGAKQTRRQFRPTSPFNPKRTEADKLDIIAVSRGVCPLTGRAIHHLYSRGPVPRTYLAAHLRPLATTP